MIFGSCVSLCIAIFSRHGGRAGELAQQQPALVADLFRPDVLVRRRVLPHRVHVQPALVREGGAADERLRDRQRHVRHVVDEARGLRQQLQVLGGQAAPLELQLQVRDHLAEVGVAGALAEAVDRPLHVRRARLDRRDAVRHRHARVVVAVEADAPADLLHDRRRRRQDVARQRAAVRIAQHDGVGAGSRAPPGSRSTRSAGCAGSRRRNAPRRRSLPGRAISGTAPNRRSSRRSLRATRGARRGRGGPSSCPRPPPPLVPAESSAARPGSFSTVSFARRVEPKATTRAVFSGRFLIRSKKAMSFSLLNGKPPSMYATPSSSSFSAMASLSSTEKLIPSPWAPSRKVAS